MLRGASKDILNEVERNLQDAMNVARNVMVDARLVPGGGAVEMALAHVSSPLHFIQSLLLVELGMVVLCSLVFIFCSYSFVQSTTFSFSSYLMDVCVCVFYQSDNDTSGQSNLTKVHIVATDRRFSHICQIEPLCTSVWYLQCRSTKWQKSTGPAAGYAFHCCLMQGDHSSWKVMEFSKTIFQAWKVMENSQGHGKWWWCPGIFCKNALEFLFL